MGFIAALLVPIIGSIGAAIVEIGIAVGLGFAARKLAPKPKSSGAATDRGRVLQLAIDTNAARQVIFGRSATAGSLVYWQTTGTDNAVLQMVVALADHECAGLVSLWIDGKERAWNSDTGVVDGFGGKLVVRFHNGASDQAVDAAVKAASEGRWTDDERGAHVCYAVVEATYDPEIFSSGNIPQIVYVIDGAKLYDPRFDSTAGGEGDQRWNDPTTWAFSSNCAVAIYNVLRGFSAGGRPLFGLNAPADAIRMSDFEAAANVCDESVGLAAGGTEPRYTCGMVVTLDGQPNRDALEALAAAMAGDIICSAGIYRIMAGVARSSVATISDADLIVTEPFTVEPRLGRGELTNAVTGSFSDPERSYNAVPLPPRTSSADEIVDGGIRLTLPMDLVAVTSRTQGQRVMEIARKRARRQLRVRCTLRGRWFGLEPGDWITFNSTRRGFVGKIFEIDHIKRNPDLTSVISLREMDDGVDDWSALTDELADDTESDLAGGGPTLNAVTGLAAAPVVIAGNGEAQMPGIRATWTAITDPTVIAVRFEFRKVGDTTALERRSETPGAGQYTWVDGVQGGIAYEIRALPVTAPERGVEWTSWVAFSGAAVTDPLKVDAAVDAEVGPGSIGFEELDAQTRFELSLATAIASVQGSVSAQLAEAFEWAQRTGEAALASLANGHENGAQLLTERVERVNGQNALAQQITTAVTRIGDNETAITEVIESVDGIKAAWGVAININGQVVGLVRLDGEVDESQLTVVADKFLIAHPDITGGTPVPVFTLSEISGETKVHIAGELIADAIRAGEVSVGQLSAISANLGTITAGLMKSSDNLFRIDLDNKEIVIETA